MNAFGARVKAAPQQYYYAPGNVPVSNAFQVSPDYLLYSISGIGTDGKQQPGAESGLVRAGKS